MRLALVALALLLPLAACSSKKANCSSAAKNAVALIRGELDKESSDGESKRKESMLPALQEELVKQCETEKWDVAARTCVAGAKSTAELDKCDPDGPGAAPRENKDADEPPADNPAAAPKDTPPPASADPATDPGTADPAGKTPPAEND